MDRKTLEFENRELKRILKLRARHAEYNDSILKRFFNTELELLACNRLLDLVKLLTVDFKHEFKLSSVSLVLFDPENIAADLLVDLSKQDRQSIRFEPNQKFLKQLYPNRQLIAGEISSELKKEIFPDSPYVLSAALLPLIRQNCLIGSLHLGADNLQKYTVDYRYDYLEHLASVISICLETCIIQENLHRLSVIDMLTNVYNRRAFNQEILKEVIRSNRKDEPLSCILLDLDYFKKVNDTYGHQTGDRVLQQVGDLLKQQLRKTDIVARYGGEEFAVLLPSCGSEQAHTIAENLGSQISAELFVSVEGAEFRMTTSLGYTTYQPAKTYNEANQRKQADTIVQLADEALYESKETGRNRVSYRPFI